MLVLAMEFSRGAQRATRGVRGQITDRQRGGSSASERPAFADIERSRRRAEGTESPRAVQKGQEPRVTPSKRNSDAHCQP
jgi:hypothetical protein